MPISKNSFLARENKNDKFDKLIEFINSGLENNSELNFDVTNYEENLVVAVKMSFESVGWVVEYDQNRYRTITKIDEKSGKGSQSVVYFDILKLS